jgi:flavin reductase (DIM6/NTAB) family NADH-FMN oxidoreductase RutF
VQLDPEQMRTRDIYRWMVGLITPRPIAWVSTVSPSGIANLAPFSFFNGVGANPPLVMFCPANGADGKPKDTLANIQSGGQFVVNLVTEPLAETMNATSAEFASEVDEFEICQLSKADSVRVTPPRVCGAAAAMECTLHQAIQLGTGPGGANLVIGRIVYLHVDDDVLDEDGNLVADRLPTIGRLGGAGYSKTTDRFDLPRPPRPQ